MRGASTSSDFTRNCKEQVLEKREQGKKRKGEKLPPNNDFKSKPWVQTLGRGSSQFFI